MIMIVMGWSVGRFWDRGQKRHPKRSSWCTASTLSPSWTSWPQEMTSLTERIADKSTTQAMEYQEDSMQNMPAIA